MDHEQLVSQHSERRAPHDHPVSIFENVLQIAACVFCCYLAFFADTKDNCPKSKTFFLIYVIVLAIVFGINLVIILYAKVESLQTFLTPFLAILGCAVCLAVPLLIGASLHGHMCAPLHGRASRAHRAHSHAHAGVCIWGIVIFWPSKPAESDYGQCPLLHTAGLWMCIIECGQYHMNTSLPCIPHR